MSYCSQCGSQNDDQSKFCAACGSKIDGPEVNTQGQNKEQFYQQEQQNF